MDARHFEILTNSSVLGRTGVVYMLSGPDFTYSSSRDIYIDNRPLRSASTRIQKTTKNRGKEKKNTTHLSMKHIFPCLFDIHFEISENQAIFKIRYLDEKSLLEKNKKYYDMLLVP